MSSRHGSRPRSYEARRADSHSFNRKEDRKVQQLCRQVHRALMYVIPGEMADPLLQDLSVQAVYPAPDATRLMVVLTTTRPAAQAAETLERIEQVRGRLRAEVVAAINRKRAPELTFQLSLAREVKP